MYQDFRPNERPAPSLVASEELEEQPVPSALRVGERGSW